jgi:hypothetical protein
MRGEPAYEWGTESLVAIRDDDDGDSDSASQNDAAVNVSDCDVGATDRPEQEPLLHSDRSSGCRSGR